MQELNSGEMRYNGYMEERQILEKRIDAWLAAEGAHETHAVLSQAGDPEHGDYTTNIALVACKKIGMAPRELAEKLKADLLAEKLPFVRDITVAGPGFVNIFLTQESFITNINSLLGSSKKVVWTTSLHNKKMMVEFAHPNTHKEMHIGHMRTLITGEALARLFAAGGATVFRANYQGDIGLHVAKAMYGIDILLKDRGQTFAEIEKLSNSDKAHFLGEAYARGSVDYEKEKEKIDTINRELYMKTGSDFEKYLETRQWSLDYYDDFYTRFYTHFDRLFFESEMVERGRDVVEKNSDGRVFEKSQGAIVFPGEKYGLHTRVFVTGAGIPTYEGKDIGNAYLEYEAFPFDKNVHVVANEQAGYFQVVFKALALLDPEKFKDSMYHLSMGMVQLTDRKMSSRTGDVLTVDWLIDQVKARVYELMTERKLGEEGRDEAAEQIAIGAIKYSVLKVGTAQNVAFSIETSVSLDGDSGPYLQYTYARTQSVLRKADEGFGENFLSRGPAAPSSHPTSSAGSLRALDGTPSGRVTPDIGISLDEIKYRLKPEEEALVKTLYRFNDVVREAAEKYSPNIVCTYLFGLAKSYNLFYQKLPILKETDELRDFRLSLTAATGNVLKEGLNLLGIKAPERM